MKLTVGIDISKQTFDAAILRSGEASDLRRKFPNKASGFLELNDWIQSFKPSEVRLGMEATGVYGDQLALFAFNANWTVFVLNPAQVKFYSRAIAQKNKTDRADCLTIARFVQKENDLVAWNPLSEKQKELRDLVREKIHVQDLMTAEKARAATAGHAVKARILARIDSLKAEIKELSRRIDELIASDAQMTRHVELITSIPGLAKWTAAVLLSEMPPVTKKTSARKMAALFGLCPRNVESGTSVRKPARLGPKGRGVVRHQLYMPALVAIRRNERIRNLADRLKAKVKSGKQIIGAAMHHLMRYVVGVLKTGQPFDPNWKGVQQ